MTSVAPGRPRRSAEADAPAQPEAREARATRDRREATAAASDAPEGGRTEFVRASSLGEETRLIEQAMVALGTGDRELARRSLEEHARRFPDGLLLRERERALVRLRQADSAVNDSSR